MSTSESHKKKKRRLEQLIEIINELMRFVEPFKPFLNSHNVQFLVEDHWQDEVLISKELREDLGEFISSEMKRSNDSTETKVNLIKYWVEFVRQDCASKNNLEELFSKLEHFKTVWNEQVVCTNDLFYAESVDYERELEEKFNKMKRQNRFMNEKKSYEVDLMSKFVARLCNKLSIKTIVDIGSGKAYLSAQLSSPVFDSAFKAIAIDSVNSNVESSLKRLSIMKRKTTVFNHEMRNKCEKEKKNEHNFQTFCEFIQSTSELNELIAARVQTESLDFDEKFFFAFVGLHSCGNLSNSIINLYLTNENKKQKYRAKCLCNVACCYNLLNEKYATDEESSKDFKHTNVQIDDSSKFPMSKHLNQMRYALNFNARMLACHSLDRCLSSINDFKELENKALWYRAVLQCILVDLIKCDPSKAKVDMKSIQIGRKLISNNESEFPSFVQYVRKALNKLELNSSNLTDEEIDKYFEKYTHMKQKFDVYIQLKQLIAPLVEHIILLDRLIFLFEHELDMVDKALCSNEHNNQSPKQNENLFESNCYEHFIVKLFDPAKSPRCYALVSYLN